MRAAQFFLVLFIIVSPIGGRDMTEREPVCLAIKVLFRSANPATVTVVRCRVTICCMVLRCGRPSSWQGSAGRECFRSQQVLQLVVGLFASYHGHLFSKIKDHCKTLSVGMR